jgi:hypothetical protein
MGQYYTRATHERYGLPLTAYKGVDKVAVLFIQLLEMTNYPPDRSPFENRRDRIFRRPHTALLNRYAARARDQRLWRGDEV